MYLSRLILNPRSRQVQKELAEPYQMHRTIAQWFAQPAAPGERLLFRVDVNSATGIPTLLLQSQQSPDFTHLHANGRDGYLLSIAEENPSMKRYEPVLRPGQVLAFRLLANPTVRRETKRRGLLTSEEQAGWMQRKAAAGGFQVLELKIEAKPPIQGPVYKSDLRHDLQVLVVQYDGVLQVQNIEQFLRTLNAGIGSAKGLGCGLLSIAPVR